MRQDLKSQIYDLDATLDSALRLMQADKRVSQLNKQNILELVEDGKSRALSKSRLIIYIYHLRRLAALTKADFRAFTAEDAKQLMKALEAVQTGDKTQEGSSNTTFEQLGTDHVGNCSYCGLSKRWLNWKDNKGNHVCQECVEEAKQTKLDVSEEKIAEE